MEEKENVSEVTYEATPEKKNKSKKGLIIALVIAFVLIAGAILTVILVINNSESSSGKDDDNSSRKSSKVKKEEVPKRKANEFADYALNFMKAAETKYVYDSIDDEPSTCYEISDLADFIEFESSYEGKVILKVDKDGDITNKYIYMTNGKYMIIDEDSESISKNPQKYVEVYSEDDWEDDYTVCSNTKKTVKEKVVSSDDDEDDNSLDDSINILKERKAILDDNNKTTVDIDGHKVGLTSRMKYSKESGANIISTNEYDAMLNIYKDSYDKYVADKSIIKKSIEAVGGTDITYGTSNYGGYEVLLYHYKLQGYDCDHILLKLNKDYTILYQVSYNPGKDHGYTNLDLINIAKNTTL